MMMMMVMMMMMMKAQSQEGDNSDGRSCREIHKSWKPEFQQPTEIIHLINHFNFENEQPEKKALFIQQVSHRKDKFAFIWQKYENGYGKVRFLYPVYSRTFREKSFSVVQESFLSSSSPQSWKKFSLKLSFLSARGPFLEKKKTLETLKNLIQK